MRIENNIPKAGKKKVSEFKHFFVLLLFIIIQLNIFVHADTAITKSMTVGETINLTTSAKGTYMYSCYITDKTNFSLEETKKGTLGNGTTYYTYKLKALKRGTFKLDIYISYYTNQSFSTSEIFNYNITVYDVTTINIPQTIDISIGEEYTYNPIITDAKANTTLTWQNSNSSVVSMNNGTITGLTAGTSTITCIAHNGITAQSKVTVKPIIANSIEINPSEYELELYKKVKLQAIISPSNVSNNNLVWNSSNPNVAMVGSDGTVTGISEGFAMITATTTDGSNLYATCLIHVFTPKILVSSIIFDNEKISLLKGESSTINASIIPSNANNPVLNWMSSDPNIVTVDENGNIYAISEGIATITASSTDGSNISKSCEITVSKKELPDNKKRGDVNGDGELTVEDITTLIQMMIE